jgi:hypothetical protein
MIDILVMIRPRLLLSFSWPGVRVDLVVMACCQTALAVEELQQRLPRARVVYVSATGASSIENIGYMPRCGKKGRDSTLCKKLQ